MVRKMMVLCALALSACGPGMRTAAPTPASIVMDTARRWNVRPVPVSEAFRRGLAAGTRTATGEPGARYWQQGVRYRIRAELDPQSTVLHGSERIVYRNRSPDALATVVLNLYQNIYTENAARNRRAPNTGGVTLQRVVAQGTTLAERPTASIGVVRAAENPAAGYAVEGTLARLVLPRPIAPGDSAVFEIDWHHRVPPAPTFRTAWEDALGARAFVVGQWYPQIAVYDDVNGWDATPYLGDGEFYLEYGDFDVDLTLPAGWIAGATGTLANAAEVLSAQTRERLARAAAGTDSVVHAVTAADLASGAALARPANGRLTWRFSARNVRDFAFATSDHYLWDAARAAVPDPAGGERTVAITALYRPGAPGWERAWRYGQHAISYLSSLVIPYAYDQATIAEGPIAGMEYPMLVFIHRAPTAESLEAVIAHELGHQWFPMMVGSDEARYAWMDEGVNSYHEDRAAADFFRGSDPRAGTRAAYLGVAGHDAEVPLMRHTDLVTPYGARTVAAYSKPAAVLVALRAVLGDNAFDRAMREYARSWSFRHPQPWDFFATFERVAGCDLDWFWTPWFFETGVLDQSIESVRAVSGGVEVVVRDRGDNPMPVIVAATSGNGVVAEAEAGVEEWLAHGGTRTVTVLVPTQGAATRVEIDPRQLLPDADRANNVWTPPAP
ncbi:M1 family metallopeptidase [Longimicrobium sp.]|uniref:M1 family metallopeptidase n=1 Tax=Longimicrobium sp. TaxID=2029185 RepID=UPI002CBC78EC|nr:M1 family metallopeptidase [Longimicrobium sp.]HSU14230.1 M1 family metallopeptidase [Longimicrobium sp.]